MIESSPDSGVASPASVADGVERSLDPAYIDVQRIIGWIVWAVLSPPLLLAVLIVAFVPSVSADVKALLGVAWLAVALLLAWLAQKWPAIDYGYFRYRVDTEGIEIRRGVVWRRLIRVPRSRVQHIDVAQGPVERRFGLGTVSIYTAGTEFAKVELPGLEYPMAVRIRDHLLPGRAGGENDGL